MTDSVVVHATPRNRISIIHRLALRLLLIVVRCKNICLSITQLCLTRRTAPAKRIRTMMKKPLLPIVAFSALLALGACNVEPETVTGSGPQDDQAAELANAAPVQLPPSVKLSKKYRCKDSSIVSVDFLSDDLSATVTPAGGSPTPLKAAAAGGAFTAEGFAVSGSGTSVDITLPGKGTQACKA